MLGSCKQKCAVSVQAVVNNLLQICRDTDELFTTPRTGSIPNVKLSTLGHSKKWQQHKNLKAMCCAWTEITGAMCSNVFSVSELIYSASRTPSSGTRQFLAFLLRRCLCHVLPQNLQTYPSPDSIHLCHDHRSLGLLRDKKKLVTARRFLIVRAAT